jgi:hypothetical protein
LTSSHRAAWRTALRNGGELRPAADAGHARAEGDVVEDRFRERIRLLENHADPAAQIDHIDVRAVDSLAIEQDLARVMRPLDQVVHPVQTA